MRKQKIIRIASDPDIATEQINEAIANLGNVSILDVYGIYPDTVIISYNPSIKPPNNRVKVVRIASDTDMATEQINEAVKDIYESYEVGDLYTYVLYPDTLLFLYDYDD
jgi:K+-transporting ATPase c subunit